MDRYAFVLRRPLQLVLVLFGISLVTFVLAQLTPGDPVRIMLGPRATLEAIATVRARYGLDKPLLVQYGYYMMNLLRADFGQSLAFRTSVLNVILERLAPTLFLLAYGLVLSILLTLGLAIAFSLRLRLFPVSGFGDSFIANLWHLFLPAVTIMLAVTPILTRNLRATMIAQISADYATAGRSKGLSEGYVFYRHVFWNSLLPTISLLGIVVSFLIGGTVVVETVFNVPGMGQLMIRAVLTRDYFVVQGVTLFFALGVVITTFIVDVVTVALDPRVKL
jgi:peptide/nickel transport system permease protein